MGQEDKNTAHSSEFLQLLMDNQMRIYAFILSLVRNYQDADDLMQETANTMWQKFGDCQPMTNFVSWGNQIAYYKILDFRKKQKSNSYIQLNDDLFEKIIPAAQNVSDQCEDRLEKLKNCLKKLGERDYKLIELRYYQDLKPRQIASFLNLSVMSIYKSISRVHGRLLDCIRSS